MTSISIERLTKRYHHKGQPAVQDLSLEMAPGEIVALLGPSGCGKTTTLRMIAGLIDPTAGDIRFDGVSVIDTPAERRGAVMVFQEHTLFPFMSVGKNIGFGLEVRGMDRASIAARIDEMLDLVRLPGFEDRRPHELSSGQRQRVALARALVTNPRVLLLDEPLANLDAHLRDEMRGLILSVQRRTGVTTIVVTHDREEAVLLADRIALIFDGRLHHYGEPVRLFQRPVSEREARFFGGVNFLPAVRKGAAAVTPVGTFALDPTKASEMPEGEVTLTIRSEHIRMCAPPGPNTVEGVLSSCIFVGTHTRCRIDLRGTEIEALKGVDGDGVSEGGNVRIGFPPEHIWLFPGRPGSPVQHPEGRKEPDRGSGKGEAGADQEERVP